MSSAKVFTMQDGQPTGLDRLSNTTDYIGPYVTHTDFNME